MFSKLVEPDSEIDDSTVQCLEIIFSSFVVVLERMLKDHLEDGKYCKPTPILSLFSSQSPLQQQILWQSVTLRYWTD